MPSDTQAAWWHLAWQLLLWKCSNHHPLSMFRPWVLAGCFFYESSLLVGCLQANNKETTKQMLFPLPKQSHIGPRGYINHTLLHTALTITQQCPLNSRGGGRRNVAKKANRLDGAMYSFHAGKLHLVGWLSRTTIVPVPRLRFLHSCLSEHCL